MWNVAAGKKAYYYCHATHLPQRDSNPQPYNHEAHALPLGHYVSHHIEDNFIA